MALITYIRVSDNLKLVRDKNLEVTDLLYIPVADSFGDLGIGDGDPAKPGAVAAYMDGDDVKLAIYQGDGTWEPVGADPTIPTLQEVTDEGSTTTNIITAGGFYANGRIRVRTDEARITFDDDIQNYSHLNLRSNIVSRSGHISVLSAGTSGAPTYGSLSTDILTSSRIFTFPDKSGTIALLDDLPPVLTFENGLREDGGVVKLGGDLTESTSIYTKGNSFLIYNDTGLSGSLGIGPVSSEIGLSSSGTTLSRLLFQVIDENIKIELKDYSEKGIVYADDYSTKGTLDPRWIPDWGAVTDYVDAGGNTFTEDNSVPNTSALSYLNTTYPDAKPGDQVYKVASGMRRTWTCYASGAWSRIDEVIEI